ncbi:unnamed protein product [Closterium sp. NIES-64]|nr:unnamed protein product [Closterium sp. NIES-64]
MFSSCLGVQEVQLRMVTPVGDTAASTRRARPASPPGFPSVPQFPPRSSLRPVVAEHVGNPTGGNRVTGGVGGRGAGLGVQEPDALALWRLHSAVYVS